MSDVNHLRLDDDGGASRGVNWIIRALIGAVIVISIVLLVTLGLVIAAMVKVNSRADGHGQCGCTDTSRTPTVVFTAKSANGSDIINGKTLAFPTTMTNIGDGYDNATGRFTAQYPGTYLFHTSVCAQKGKWAFVNLMANNESLASTGVYDVDAHGSCTSVTGIAVLSKGDTSWVEGAWDEPGALYLSGSYTLPTFTGVLLHLQTE